MKPQERFEKLLQQYENDPEYIAEGLMIDITEQIVNLMNTRKLSRSDLASKLKCSNAYITKLLNGSENLTIKKLVQIAQALGMSMDFAFVPDQCDIWRSFKYKKQNIKDESFKRLRGLKESYESILSNAA
jgi:transcriptional regulator with XRE-family HTH domain